MCQFRGLTTGPPLVKNRPDQSDAIIDYVYQDIRIGSSTFTRTERYVHRGSNMFACARSTVLTAIYECDRTISLLGWLLYVYMRMCWLVTYRRYLGLCIFTPLGYVRAWRVTVCVPTYVLACYAL